MRIPRRTVPIQPLTYMWERHKEIARLQVVGLKPIEIAAKLGMTTCRISLIMNSPVYKEYLSTLSEKREEAAFDMKRELQKGAEKGVELLCSYLDKNDGEVPINLKTRIAQDFLDRSGYGKTTTVNTNTLAVHQHTVSIIDVIKEKRKALLGGLVLEAEVGS